MLITARDKINGLVNKYMLIKLNYCEWQFGFKLSILPHPKSQ